jgi:hypothetical protein
VGLAGFYRRKVKDLAKIAEPLTRLTKKKFNPYVNYKKHKDSEHIEQQINKQSLLEKMRPIRWNQEQELSYSKT